MRNPNRIAPILKEVERIWLKHPDMRLGQLLLNVKRDPAIYYIEDDELLEAMKELYDKRLVS